MGKRLKAVNAVRCGSTFSNGPEILYRIAFQQLDEEHLLSCMKMIFVSAEQKINTAKHVAGMLAKRTENAECSLTVFHTENNLIQCVHVFLKAYAKVAEVRNRNMRDSFCDDFALRLSHPLFAGKDDMKRLIIALINRKKFDGFCL